MASEILNRKAQEYAIRVSSYCRKHKKWHPAAVIGAEYGKYMATDRSRPCNPAELHIRLYTKLNKQGGLFLEVNGNLLGCCCEVNAGNKILRNRKYLKLNQIIFSDAIRPRTMQRIKTCKNCNETFSL